jgi:hypothetical protein
MDVSTKLFGEFLVFVYHCFDRIVIHGYLTALSRPELVVHFFRDIIGVAEVSKEVLSQRTNDYPALGGGLCAQSCDPDRVGRKGDAQRRSRAAMATPDGAVRCVRRLLRLQEHGAGTDLRARLSIWCGLLSSMSVSRTTVQDMQNLEVSHLIQPSPPSHNGLRRVLV